MVTDRRERFGKSDGGQKVTAGESIVADGSKRFRKGDVG
jgi:hypothetical protein